MRAITLQWISRAPWIAWSLTLLGALLLKLHYHRATVGQLRWMLGPTARFVGWMRNEVLVLDPSLGYLPVDGSWVIAPACAGVNFLILAVVVAVLGFVHRFERPRVRAAWLLGAALGAFALTIVVNALRIVLAVELYAADAQFGWLTPDRVHRVAGTVIYVAALWGWWHALEWLCARVADRGFEWRRPVWLLLGAYLGMTLLVPLFNGALQRNGFVFVEHALSVAAVAAFVMAVLETLARRWPRRRVFASGARVNTSL